MERKSLYIILTRTNSLLSKLIQLVKKDIYTHAAISLDKNLTKMYSFGRKYTYLPFMGCLGLETIEAGIYKKQKILPGVILEIKVTDWQYNKANKILEDFIKNKENYKFHYAGLFDHLLNREVKLVNKFLCSDFIYRILKSCGILDLSTPENLVRPQNILLGLSNRIIYEGDLKKFQSSHTYQNWKKELSSAGEN